VTVRNSKSLRDVIATADYRANSALTLNSKYDLGAKIYTLGTTWNGQVAKRVSTIKARDGSACGGGGGALVEPERGGVGRKPYLASFVKPACAFQSASTLCFASWVMDLVTLCDSAPVCHGHLFATTCLPSTPFLLLLVA
jgi:hypothetical protein